MISTGTNIWSAVRQSHLIPPSGISRYFTDLLAAGSQHYTIPTRTIVSGDIIRAKFVASTNGSNRYLTDGSNVGERGWFLFNSAGNFQMNTNVFNSSTVKIDGIITSVWPSDGKLHDIEIDVIGSGDIALIGSRFNVQETFNSILSDFQIERSSVLLRDYRIDQTWIGPSTILIDSGSDELNGAAVSIDSDDALLFTAEGDDWISTELITNSDFATDTIWEKSDATISGGAAHLDSLTGVSSVSQDVSTAGDYRVSYTIATSNGMSESVGIQLRDYTGSDTVAISGAVGNHEVIITNADFLGNTGFQIRSNFSVGWTGSVSNFSAKKLLEQA